MRQGKNLGMYYVHFRQGNKQLMLDNTHDELDWLLSNSACQILFYDEKQSVSPSDVPHERFITRLCERKRGIRPVALNEQMRIRAGGEYVPYIYDILYQKTTVVKSFENYEFKLFSSFSDMINLLDERENAVGLSRLCAGYAWEWKGKRDATLVDINIDGVNIKWNSQTGGWLKNPDVKKEMGSIYTLSGLDLNYAGVVIGSELFFDTADNKIKVNRNNFFDNKVKNDVTDEELKSFILNTYAVFLTRGIRGTYIYICDDNLREYFKKYILF